MQIILSVAEHHGNLVPWQLLAARTGAVLRFVPLTKDKTELDMAVGILQIFLYASCFIVQQCRWTHDITKSQLDQLSLVVTSISSAMSERSWSQ